MKTSKRKVTSKRKANRSLSTNKSKVKRKKIKVQKKQNVEKKTYNKRGKATQQLCLKLQRHVLHQTIFIEGLWLKSSEIERGIGLYAWRDPNNAVQNYVPFQ